MPTLPRVTYEEDEEPTASSSDSSVPPPSCFVCIDCNQQSPPTRTGETLISSQHGWRANRHPLPDGRIRVDWRCAKCWATFRATKLGTF